MSCANCGNPNYKKGETCFQCGVGPQIGPGGNSNFREKEVTPEKTKAPQSPRFTDEELKAIQNEIFGDDF